MLSSTELVLNMMNRHAVEGKYFHVILLTDDSTVRSLDRSRSFYDASSFHSSFESVISANACPSEAAAVQIVEEVHHHTNSEFVLSGLHIY